MFVKIGSSVETKMINEAKSILEGGLQNLALAVYQVVNAYTPGNDLLVRDRFFAGLVYSEFMAEDTSAIELCACEDRREAICKRLGIDSYELFKLTENTFQPGRIS